MIAQTFTEVLAAVTGRSVTECSESCRVPESGLGVAGLTLLETVETLQGRLIITVPDKVTDRVRTVRDLQDAVSTPVSAAPLDISTGKDNFS
ncbi:hypothetical protein OH809_02015 [Streptomyces sp. NBC_00873]|uniref:hypothetical protein n=1 Tax=unclassified Streptomyces TaxID=2593676 RepID=UPI00386B0915|nr:hypothetical protein OH809_02015 [Streptomyces sp. NBC_00873]WTA48289.1 hypothetical protein OH821_41795 [Streptomyces sp. NBC_00842]